MSPVPVIRVTRCNEVPVHEKGDYVLYWMTGGGVGPRQASDIGWNSAEVTL